MADELSPETLEAINVPVVRHTLVKRAGWGALEAKEALKPLQHPAKHVVLAFNTKVASCSTKDECKERMREIQKLHMDKGLPDIHYNFAIGGDGNLYEGRGWNFQPESFKENPEFDEIGICIGFIGDAEDLDPENQMAPLFDAIYLANSGVDKGYLEEEYIISEDKQTFE